MTTDPIVAVVDDESPVRTMLERVLRLGDFRVTSFASGEDLLASLHAQRPACVILDVHMPGLSGFEVHARMRSTGIAIPVVFMTASDDAAVGNTARRLAARLLRKPFSSDDLLKAVGAAIANTDAGP